MVPSALSLSFAPAMDTANGSNNEELEAASCRLMQKPWEVGIKEANKNKE